MIQREQATRKHYSQFSREEIERMQARIAELIPSRIYTHHAEEKMAQLNIREEQIAWQGKIIEFNHNQGDSNVLIREQSGICWVMSLNTGKIITIWRNNPYDNHRTLNWSLYTRQIQISWIQQ